MFRSHFGSFFGSFVAFFKLFFVSNQKCFGAVSFCRRAALTTAFGNSPDSRESANGFA